jgi:hypothetical protein
MSTSSISSTLSTKPDSRFSFASSSIRLSKPNVLQPDPSSGALDPINRNPVRTFMRNNNIVTGHPNVASAVPAPVSWIPVVTRFGWSRSFNDHLWGCDANIDIG